MKLVRVRLSAQVPELFSKPLRGDLSEEEWRQLTDTLLAWAGSSREEARFEEDNPAAVAWAQVAWRIAYHMLPAFRGWRFERRVNRGGRPAKDRPSGLFGLANPHAELMRAVHLELIRATKRGDKVSVVGACKALERKSKTLLPRYHNLSARRLARLYYDGKFHEKKFGPTNALAQVFAGAPEFVRESVGLGKTKK